MSPKQPRITQAAVAAAPAVTCSASSLTIFTAAMHDAVCGLHRPLDGSRHQEHLFISAPQ